MEDPNCDVVDAGPCGQPCQTRCGTQGEWDCSTGTCAVPREICDNGVDDDCNGLTDCEDPACAGDPSCAMDAGTACVDGAACQTTCGTTGTWNCTTSTCTPPAEICGDGIDNDCNGLVDCADPACADAANCCQDGTACQTTCGTTGTWDCATSTCTPPAEICGDGIDNDCNGLVDCADPACSGTAACCGTPGVCDVIGCNGDWGQNNIEDKATAPCWQDPGDCTPQNLDAWCTRRGDTDYLWPDLVQQSVVNNCPSAGEVIAVTPVPGTNYGEQYQCVQNGCVTYTCDTPLVLVFNPLDEVHFIPDDGRCSFDLSAPQDGSGAHLDWPTAATPWLALDLDGDGAITSGRELFGSATLVDGRPAQNGFEALAALDYNGDGRIDPQDPAFGRIRVWADINGDRQSSPDEIHTLDELGVVALQLTYKVAPRCDDRGNCEVERGRFTWRAADGSLHDGAIVDVHLGARG